MRLLVFDDYRLGAIVDEQVADVTEVVDAADRGVPELMMSAVIRKWDEYRSRIDSGLGSSPQLPFESVRVLPPIPAPKNIVCMAVNYMEDGTLERRPQIAAFPKPPSALIGDQGIMVLPDTAATIFEGEAELAVVIGRETTRVAAEEAMKSVFGYTNFIDGSARGLASLSIFYPMKSRDTFAPVGPYIVTADEVKDPQDLPVKLWNNGQLMQHFNTSDMAHDIAHCIEFVSGIHTLYPGDIIATGTNHRGLNPFMDGDKIELEVADFGRLRITVQDELKRTWPRQTRLERQQAGLEGATAPQASGKYAPDDSKGS